jgi:hypothetical protein
MSFSRLPLVLLSALALPAVACGSFKDSNALPDGVTCASQVNAGGDGSSLTSALASAKGGSCVILSAQTYTGNFLVPAGVTVVSERQGRATIVGASASSPAIELTGGAGSSLQGVDVLGAAGVGVAVRGGAAKLSDVNVEGAKNAALAILCAGATCLDDAHVVTLDAVHLKKSAMGMWVSGARVTMNGGECTDHASDGLASSAGIVGQSGAHLELTGVDVERNQGVGVLLDGEGGTTAMLHDMIVSNNAERGIWAQKLAGTIDAPALRIDGNTVIEANKIVGVGAAESHGIIFVGGKINGTVAAPVATDLGQIDQVGDGIGLFSGSGDVRIENVALTANARASGLIDSGTGVIIFVGGKIEAGASALKLVIQNTTGVDVPAENVSMSPPLSVSAPRLPLAKVLN